MGAQASLMSADRQEKAEEIERSMIAHFQSEYLAEYRAQLMAELNSEAEATDGLLAGSVNQLKSRPVSATQAPPPPLYSGWLTKCGAVRKTWKRRWFVVSPDYSVAYYAGSDNRGAPKGELVLQGYEVRADCFRSDRDLCIELYHRKRRCYYVCAGSAEEYEQWMPILKEVCRKARYQIHADPLRARAFEVAFEATQKMMEVASERLPEISEADALTELVCDMIHDIVLSDTFMADDPHGSGGKHSLTSKTVLMKRLEMRVGAEVATALQSINDQAEHFRRRVKPELKALWPEFVSEEDNLNERIEEVILPVVQPALNRMVKPSVRRILNVIIPIIADAYVRVLSEFHEASQQTINTIASEGMERAVEIVSELSRSVAGTVRYKKHPLNPIVGMVERLTSLFDEGVTEVLEEDGIVVHPDAIVDTVLAALQTVMDQAVYVFDDEINEYRNSTTDLQAPIADLRKLHQRSVNALHHDCHASMATLIGTVTKGMVLPPYLEHVAAPAHELTARNFPAVHRAGGQVSNATDQNDSNSGATDTVSVIHQTLDVKKMTQAKIISLAAEPIQRLAVEACVSPLIGSRGGGECPVCQAKIQAAALEERERSTEDGQLSVSEIAGQHHQHAAAAAAVAVGGGGGGGGGGGAGAIEQERHTHPQADEDGEEGDDSYAGLEWGWDSEERQRQPAGGVPVDSMAAASTGSVMSMGMGVGGRADVLAQERVLGHAAIATTRTTGGSSLSSGAVAGGVGSMSTLPAGVAVGGGGGARRPMSMRSAGAHHSASAAGVGVAASVGVGVGTGPSIQAMSAQWRQGLSLQRPALARERQPTRSTPSSAMRGAGAGSGAAGPAAGGVRGATSPTRSRHSDGERSSRSGDS